MKPRFSYQHIFLALLATLILAGLFYLPYLSVRNRTIETFHAQQTQEVLSLIEQAENHIDLVITDQTMPNMTGVELTRKIRHLHPGVPVILCTGYSDRLNYDIAKEAGAGDLLMKPVDLRGLSGAVRAALDMNG